MINIYRYELWNGKKVLGHYTTCIKLFGNYLVVPEYSILKEPYSNSTIREFKVPIMCRIVRESGTDIIIRVCLDIRRKSKRQIKILSERSK